MWQETIHYRTKVLCYVPLDIAELLAIHKNRNGFVVIRIVRLSDKLKSRKGSLFFWSCCKMLTGNEALDGQYFLPGLGILLRLHCPATLPFPRRPPPMETASRIRGRFEPGKSIALTGVISISNRCQLRYRNTAVNFRLDSTAIPDADSILCVLGDRIASVRSSIRHSVSNRAENFWLCSSSGR